MPFQAGDTIMAGKGFDIQDLLDPISVKLNMPPFLYMQDQMPTQHVVETQQIAAERIQVERAINKIKKNFHIFDQIISLLSGWFYQPDMDSLWITDSVAKPYHFIMHEYCLLACINIDK